MRALLAGVPEGTTVALGLQVPTLPLIKTDDSGIGEQAHTVRSYIGKNIQHVGHQITTQAIALIKRVDGNIPDSGLKYAVTRAASEADQSGDAGVMPPEPHRDQAVIKRLTDAAHWSSAPADGFEQLLKLHKIKRMGLAKHQANLIVVAWAEAGVLPVLLQEGNLWDRQRGLQRHSFANPRS